MKDFIHSRNRFIDVLISLIILCKYKILTNKLNSQKNNWPCQSHCILNRARAIMDKGTCNIDFCMIQTRARRYLFYRAIPVTDVSRLPIKTP